MKLTEAKVKNAKPRAKQYRVADQKGLYLQVQPNGSKYWRYKYRMTESDRWVERVLSLGTYLQITLAVARERHMKAYQMRSEGRDPALIRKQEKELARVDLSSSFGAVATDWFATRSPTWSDSHRKRQDRLLNKELASLFSVPISEIKAPLMLAVVRKIENRGVIETAKRANQIASQVFRHGIAMGIADSDPASLISDALKKAKHHRNSVKPLQAK